MLAWGWAGLGYCQPGFVWSALVSQGAPAFIHTPPPGSELSAEMQPQCFGFTWIPVSRAWSETDRTAVIEEGIFFHALFFKKGLKHKNANTPFSFSFW